MAQVRVEVLNGELSPNRISAHDLAVSRHNQSTGPASPNWHRSPNKINRDMLAESPGA